MNPLPTPGSFSSLSPRGKSGLDLNSYVPLYQQLKEWIKKEIASGTWKTGEMIPSENELAAAFSISPGTVKKALSELVREGVIARRRGKGSFVARPDFRRSLFRFFRHGSGAGFEGVLPVSRVLFSGSAKAPAKVATALHLGRSRACIRITRVRSLGGTPIMFEHIYLPHDRFGGIETVDISKELLYPIYESRFGTPIVWAEEFLEPHLASAEVERNLGIRQGSPVIYIERIAYTFGDVPVEFRCSTGRGDRFRYHIELR